MSGTKWIHGLVDDPYVCLADELTTPPLLAVHCGCEIVGWSSGGVRIEAVAGVFVDVASNGGVGVNKVGVVVEFGVMEVKAGMVERLLFFFSWPLSLPAISEINIYNIEITWQRQKNIACN